jgi:hypothetical protein
MIQTTRTSNPTTTTIEVDPRWNGPADSGNGGFSTGVIAGLLDGAAVVSLHAGVPLGAPLEAHQGADRQVQVRHHGALVASAVPGEPFREEPPRRPTYDAAERARARHPWRDVRHHLSDCVVCGPHRVDGLGVTPGPLEGDDMILAAPYVPVAEHGSSHGEIDRPQIWGALDCVSYPAHLMAAQRLALLVSMSVHQLAPVRTQERYVAVGWTRRSGTRSHHTSSALIDLDGRTVASSRAVWVELAAPKDTIG